MRKERRKAHVSQDRWMVSYADFITLLFAFFVVLYAFAKADQKKQMPVSVAIDDAFRSLGIFPDATRKPADGATATGVDPAAIPMNIVMGEDVLSPAKVKEDLDNIRRDLEQKLSNQVATHTVSIQMGRDGLVISLREAGFFDSGSAAPGDFISVLTWYGRMPAPPLARFTVCGSAVKLTLTITCAVPDGFGCTAHGTNLMRFVDVENRRLFPAVPVA